MSSKARLLGALASSLLLAMVGCAVGTADPDVQTGELTTTPLDSGKGNEEESVKLPPPSTSEQPAEDAGVADAAPKADAAPQADGGSNNNNNNNNNTSTTCTAVNQCAGATDMGAVSGDTGADVLTASGTGSQWFRVWVTENDNGVAGVKLLASATLVSPAGTNYDLYLYNGSSSAHECSAVSAQSTNGAATDQASVSFGEGGLFANGSDDSRYVTVEVRHVSGPCGASAKWQLSFNGNQ